MDMWTASAESDHISTAPTTATPLILRRETEHHDHDIYHKGDPYLKIAILVS